MNSNGDSASPSLDISSSPKSISNDSAFVEVNIDNVNIVDDNFAVDNLAYQGDDEDITYDALTIPETRTPRPSLVVFNNDFRNELRKKLKKTKKLHITIPENNTSFDSPDTEEPSVIPCVVPKEVPQTESGEKLEAQLPAVDVRGLKFSHGTGKSAKQILCSVDINVPKSSVYCLIGPSGCGKTTLLKCVTGCYKPSSGFIRVFGFEPGEPGSDVPGRSIGYMPQELALYEDLTIGEILIYFGKLNGLDPAKILKRTKFLITFLALPREYGKRFIGTLSGGQKRRVSLAAALIHRPPLLILDEPTAGVDPLLADSVWKHLKALTQKEQITVIITTHYIEESRQSDIVGLMRKGRILAEGSPCALIEQYEAKSVEDVFLKICTMLAQNKSPDSAISKTGQNGHPLAIPTDSYPKHDVKVKRIEYIRKYILMTQALFWKNWTRNRRHPELIAFQFFLPALIVILFSYCIGAHPFHIPVAIVNQDHDGNLSKLFLAGVDSYLVNQHEYTRLSDALYAVKKGYMWGAVHIKPNFSESLDQRLIFLSDPDDEGDNSTIEGSTIKIYADLTNKITSITMKRTFEEAFQRFLRAWLEFDGFNLTNRNLAQLPVMVYPIYGEDLKYKGNKLCLAYAFNCKCVKILIAKS